MDLTSAEGAVVLPGDTVGELRRDGSAQAGFVAARSAERYNIAGVGKNYVPRVEDSVVGVVVEKHAEMYKIDIGGSKLAMLPVLAFEGATKRNRPYLAIGALVYARVVVAHKDMDPELQCTSAANKADGYGALLGGFVAHCSPAHARRLLEPKAPLLEQIGRKIPFELAVGVNGRVWVNSASATHTVFLVNAIQQAEHVGPEQYAALVKGLLMLVQSSAPSAKTSTMPKRAVLSSEALAAKELKRMLLARSHNLGLCATAVLAGVDDALGEAFARQLVTHCSCQSTLVRLPVRRAVTWWRSDLDLVQAATSTNIASRTASASDTLAQIAAPLLSSSQQQLQLQPGGALLNCGFAVVALEADKFKALVEGGLLSDYLKRVARVFVDCEISIVVVGFQQHISAGSLSITSDLLATHVLEAEAAHRCTIRFLRNDDELVVYCVQATAKIAHLPYLRENGALEGTRTLSNRQSTAVDLYVSMLQQIPRVTRSHALAIAESLPTLRALYDELQRRPAAEIFAGVRAEYHTGASRRVGPVTATRVATAITGRNADLVLSSSAVGE